MASIGDFDSVPTGHKVFSQALQESTVQVITLRFLSSHRGKNFTAKEKFTHLFSQELEGRALRDCSLDALLVNGTNPGKILSKVKILKHNIMNHFLSTDCFFIIQVYECIH